MAGRCAFTGTCAAPAACAHERGLRHAWSVGGWRGAWCRGLAPALVQAPLSRFGDTAANAGALSLLNSFDSTVGLPIAVKTAAASVVAASFRILLVPVDTLKTMYQVEGKEGWNVLRNKVQA